METKRHITERAALAALAATIVACAAPPATQAQTPQSLRAGAPVLLSGRTPFPDSCDVPGIQPGAEAAPTIAIDRADARNIAVAWEQDLDKGEGALSALVAVSHDGGTSFARKRIAGLSRCTGGERPYATSPLLAFGSDGTLYLATIAYGGTRASEVTQSRNGGATWDSPRAVADDARSVALVADPSIPGRAYLAVTTPRPQGAAIQIVLTTDAGRTWAEPRSIYEPLAEIPTLHDLAIDPDGNLIAILEQSPQLVLPPTSDEAKDSDTPLLAIHSSDRGETWSAPVEIGRLPDTTLPHDPERGEPGDNRGRIGAPVIATAAATDRMAIVAWQSNLAFESGQILSVVSRDRGTTWSEPTAVASLHAQAFTPELAAGTDGALGLSWYDLRGDRRGDEELTAAARFAHSVDGGATWTDIPLSPSFDLRRAPEHYGRSLGSRQGLAPLAGGFAATFTQAPDEALDGPSDIFFALLRRASAESLKLRVRPPITRAGRRTQFNFRVTRGSGSKARAVRGASIAFAGRRARTNPGGRASLTLTLSTPGRYPVKASKRGLRPATAIVHLRAR